ncbi:MAG: DNA/RNA nuclease SfsA [Pseudomonadota bacterium]
MKKSAYLAEYNGGLAWGPLIQGTLVRRYKRFLAQVKLKNNRLITALCPNTGSMLSCSEPGRPVYLSRHNVPTRKLKYTWEMIEMPDSLVGVNTLVPNKLVRAGVLTLRIPELAGYDLVRTEVRTSQHTRLDLVLTGSGGKICFVEIKNCTLVAKAEAFFPDAVTSRGKKHLEELTRLVSQGARSVIFFLIQRLDAGILRPADHIDPEYGLALRAAVRAGVEPLAYDVVLDQETINLNRAVPVKL